MKSQEELQKMADAFSSEMGVKVYPLSFTDANDKQVIGFLKEPSRQAKLAAMDDLMKSATQAGETILNACLIAEKSDPRILSDDDVYVSATMDCLTIIKVYQNDVKKK